MDSGEDHRLDIVSPGSHAGVEIYPTRIGVDTNRIDPHTWDGFGHVTSTGQVE